MAYSDIQQTMLEDYEEIESDMGNQTFTWMGADYVCIPSNPMEDTILSIGGYERVASLILKVRTNLFANSIYPTNDANVIFAGREYTIGRVDFDIFNVVVKLTLISSTQGI